MVKWLNVPGIMILIKSKQVNREVEILNPADIIYQYSIFHVISHVTKTSIYIIQLYSRLGDFLKLRSDIFAAENPKLGF